MRFCPGCGKKLRKEETFCRDCRPSPDLKVKDIVVKICASCRKYYHKCTWKNYNELDKAIIRVVRDSIKEKGIFIKPVLPETKFNPGMNIDFSVEISRGDELFIIPANIEVTYCSTCSKKQGEYFEGVLQLRKVSDKVLDFIANYTKKNNIFITKQTKVKNGLDLKITDQRKVQQLAHQLQKNYGGTLKVSPSVFSKDRQTSRDVHRVNVYYEAPDYTKGDVIKVDGKIIQVTGLKQNITGIDLKTGNKVSVNMGKKEYRKLDVFRTRVTKVYPVIEVLDPNYQSVPVQNKKEVSRDEKVKAVNDSGLYYVL